MPTGRAAGALLTLGAKHPRYPIPRPYFLPQTAAQLAPEPSGVGFSGTTEKQPEDPVKVSTEEEGSRRVTEHRRDTWKQEALSSDGEDISA